MSDPAQNVLPPAGAIPARPSRKRKGPHKWNQLKPATVTAILRDTVAKQEAGLPIAKAQYSDGGNLYLRVLPNGSVAWVFRYSFRGHSHSLGLGRARDIPLAKARDEAQRLRVLLIAGINPIVIRGAKD